MLHLAIQRRLFEFVLNLFEGVCKHRSIAEASLELVDNFEKQGLEHPEVDSDVVVQVAHLNSPLLNSHGRDLGRASADLTQLHDVMYPQETK